MVEGIVKKQKYNHYVHIKLIDNIVPREGIFFDNLKRFPLQ